MIILKLKTNRLHSFLRDPMLSCTSIQCNFVSSAAKSLVLETSKGMYIPYTCRYMRKSNYHMYNYVVVYVCACNKRKHIIFVNLSIGLRTLGVSFQRLCIDAYLCPMLAGLLVSSQRFAKRFHTSSGHTKEQYCGSVDFCEHNLFPV